MILRRLACSAVLVLAACSSKAAPTAVAPIDTPEVSVGSLEPVVIADGFNAPTQIADGPDGLLIVAQLNGEENASTGQVLSFDPTTKAKRVLLDKLDKPTGVTWTGDTLWVMVHRGLLRASWPSGAPTPGPVEKVLDNLPFNGRSEGTLTPVANGQILYETTGALVGDTPEPGSGTLWAFDPSTKTSRPVATGVKNAYAHAVLGEGRIVTTEIGDNIADAPVEEINVIPLAATSDLGWPRCPGDKTCPGIVQPAATFPKNATPTGIAVVGTDAYVSLFVTGQLMRVSLASTPSASTEVLKGLKGPHTVLARPDGTLWITEHLANRIIAIRPTP